jgi:hypothetical protein
MMRARAARYNGYVNGFWGRGAAVLFLVLTCWLGAAARSSAAEQIDVGPTPVLNVRLGTGTLTVKTWDRPQVQVESAGQVKVHHLDAAQADPRIRKQYLFWSQTVDTPQGPVVLPETAFVLPKLQGDSHDAVEARGNGNTTITIPRGTALVTASVRDGEMNLDDYRGVFIAHVRQGGITMNRVHGTGFVETLQGDVNASNSTFDRLRVRTATGNMNFRGCTSHQIEATSTYGSIVYDNGSFKPGLARFESEHGNVALGVRGGAQIGAHSGSGHIVSSFHNNGQTRGRNTSQTTVRGGGPVVTAISRNGSVYLYNGSARGQRRRAQQQQRYPVQRRYPARQRYPVQAYPAPRYPLPPVRYAPQQRRQQQYAPPPPPPGRHNHKRQPPY